MVAIRAYAAGTQGMQLGSRNWRADRRSQLQCDHQGLRVNALFIMPTVTCRIMLSEKALPIAEVRENV